jgi:hypothetical protein
MQDLMREAAISARQGGERGVSARRIRKVRAVCLLSSFSLEDADGCWIEVFAEVQGMSSLWSSTEGWNGRLWELRWNCNGVWSMDSGCL